MAVAMVTTAVEQTPTIDEPVYLGAGVVQVQEHSLRYNPEHPPLGKLVIGSGMLFTDARPDPGFSGNQTELGRHLLYESGNDPWRLMLWARLPVIALTLLFGLVVLALTRDLTGQVGALAALALYTFSPDVIAHGSLATLDVPMAGFLLTSVWLLWRARRRPLRCLPAAGVALGAAVATKMSALAAVPVLLPLAVLSFWCARRAGNPEPLDLRGAVRLLARGVAAAVGVGLVALAVVWASYLAVDPRLRWTTPPQVPDLRGLRELAVEWMPFPEPFRDGMRIQFRFEYARHHGYLFGHHYIGSFWYYLPVALLVKTPLGMLALWAAGAVALVAVRRFRPAAPYLLVPSAVLMLAAMDGSRDFGVRYVVFLPMFLAVAAGCATAVRWRWSHAVTAVLVVWVAVSSLRTYPFYLPYANEAFGGPSRTHRYLHDSNVDWGQDLGRLADRLRTRYPRERVWLVYKGSGVPSAYGIEASDPRGSAPERVHGLLAVSDSSAALAGGRLADLLDSSTPVEEVGHSITLYRR
ncbi:phospholipid carrier-dependent glycosyltransferase [Streptomyces sp. NA02950]|uniref:phospholipid carrier-dependent glycosyltransferase n=1 Tax=Streptomyces sp. NA02950 TaxID=2742137 RepID=UPI0020CAF31D|nr:phospholipid carrier-dependent glycosyltransferase [Streptomyces sp. NA02950]